MILVKNKLRRKKHIFDDEDYLNYLKYSHVSTVREYDESFIETEDKATQEPDILNNFTQTDSKEMVDKETDTYNELNKIIGEYVLKMSSKNFKSKEPSRSEKMAQAWTLRQKPREAFAIQMIQPRDKPSSSSSSSGSEGFLGRNIRRGFRLAEFAGNAVSTTFNVASDLADYLAEATATRQQQESEDEEPEQQPTEEQTSASTDFRRERSRSHDSDHDLGDRLLRRGASRSRSSSRDGGYPKKKKIVF